MSSYDQNLLDAAPKATRAQLQEGYNVDLLEQPPRRTPSVRSPVPQTPQRPPVTVPLLAPGLAEAGSGDKFGSPHAAIPPKPRTSFWRSRNGIITIVILLLLLVGAVVGGAVGGTVKKNSSNNVDTTGTKSTSTSASASSASDTLSSGSTSTVTPATDSAATVGSQGIGGPTGSSRGAGVATSLAPTSTSTLASGQNNIGKRLGRQRGAS